MTASEKKFVERNLDLMFEFEKYVLDHPAIAERIPRDAVVFIKVTGDPKFNRWSERQAKKHAKKGAPLISIHGEKNGTGSFPHRRDRARACCLNATTPASFRATGP